MASISAVQCRLLTWSSGAVRDQTTHDTVVAQMRRGDQRRAVVAAGDELRAGAEFQQQRQRPFVVGHRCDRHRVVAVVLQRAEIGAGGGEAADRVGPTRVRRHVQRRPAISVARVDHGTRGQEPADRRSIATPRGLVQGRPGGAFRLARSDLRLRGQHGGQRGATPGTAAQKRLARHARHSRLQPRPIAFSPRRTAPPAPPARGCSAPARGRTPEW